MATSFDLFFQTLVSVDRKLDMLLANKDTSTNTPDEKGGIELAKRVTNLSRPRIYTLVSERKIPHAKRGGRLYFSRSALEKWIEDGHRACKTEPTI